MIIQHRIGAAGHAHQYINLSYANSWVNAASIPLGTISLAGKWTPNVDRAGGWTPNVDAAGKWTPNIDIAGTFDNA